MKDFIRKYDKLYMPFMADHFGVEIQEVTDVICEMWDEFENPQMVENMLIKNNEKECNFYEVCNTKYKRGKFIPSGKIEDYCFYNSGSDQHISVFKHDKSWTRNVKRHGSVSCSNTYVSADWLYLELDRSEGYHKALEDAKKIYDKFEYKDRMVLWFSGNNSVHVAVHASLFGYPMGHQSNVCGLGKLFYNLANEIAGDVRHENGESDPWLLSEQETLELYFKTKGIVKNKADISELKQELENVDPNLFRVNSLIRQPWSEHEKSGNLKCMIDPITLKNISKKKFDIGDKKPYLIHLVPKCYKARFKQKPIIRNTFDSNKVTQIYSVLEGFNPDLADHFGWINNLYSPFYEDTKPSVAVNINTGVYKDHGEPTHAFDLVGFYAKLNDLEYDEAKEAIKDR